MSSARSLRRTISLESRLKLILALMVVWDGLGLAAELSFSGPLFKISGHDISGILGAHGSFGGSLAVPLVLYVYALVRGPLRYRGLVWVGVLEQGVAIFFTLYHTAVSPMKAEAIVTPLVVSIALLVLLLMNLPTGEPTT